MILYINPRQKDENFRDDRRNELPEKKYKKKNDDKAVAFEEPGSAELNKLVQCGLDGERIGESSKRRHVFMESVEATL